MPGLVPGIHVSQHGGMSGGWVYIMTDRPNGTLYPAGSRWMDVDARNKSGHDGGNVGGVSRIIGIGLIFG